MDTIRYEIEMFRHCAQTLKTKQEKMVKELDSDALKAEYYLGLEGFLLHTRNLLGFLANYGNRPTDLVLNKPGRWTDKKLEEHEYSDLVEHAKGVDQKYGKDKRSCYDQISKFLQHCTTFRHEEARTWDVEGIFSELDPILQDFEIRFRDAGPSHHAEVELETTGEHA